MCDTSKITCNNFFFAFSLQGDSYFTTLEIFVTAAHRGWFSFMVILDPQGVPFHPAIVFCLGFDFLFKFILRHCAEWENTEKSL